jgi:predicted SPOUT superfamily RNA methylase MTH1
LPSLNISILPKFPALTSPRSAQSHDLKTMMAAQVARACAVFQVDEIVVFNDGQSQNGARPRKGFEGDGYTGYSDPDDFLYHVLSYLETPPHLRKTLFPMHPNLRTAGAMPSLDMPHHLRANEWCQYREGVTMGADAAFAEPHNKRSKGHAVSTLVDCGLAVKTRIPVEVPPGSRVTVKFASADEPQMDGYTPLDAEAVSPDTPREETGYYWGYSTRMASSLSAVFTECPYDGGYDVSFGTSERGITLASLFGASDKDSQVPPVPTNWRHMVIVFGGVAGLEVALKADKNLTSKGVTEAKDVFDYWVNLAQKRRYG